MECGGAGRGRKLIGRNCVNLIVSWCGQFLFFCQAREEGKLPFIKKGEQGKQKNKTLASGQKIKFGEGNPQAREEGKLPFIKKGEQGKLSL